MKGGCFRGEPLKQLLSYCFINFYVLMNTQRQCELRPNESSSLKCMNTNTHQLQFLHFRGGRSLSDITH